MDEAAKISKTIFVNSKIKTWQIFMLLSFSYLLMALISNTLIFSRETYHSLLSERMESTQIDDYMNLVRKMNILQYFMVPVLLWFKISFIAMLIQLPLLIKFIQISFKQIFRIVALAQISVLLASVIIIANFLFFSPESIDMESLKEVPLSLTSFLDSTQYSMPVWNFLNSFNFFDILWIIIVCKGITSTGKLDMESSVILVLSVWISILVLQFAISFYINNIMS